MPNEAAPVTGGAPTPSPSPTPAPTPAPSPSPTPTPTPAPAGDFKVPDAYKDKPWAQKVKSNDDVWKALEGSQELIGKKVLPNIDFKNATAEQLVQFNEAHRPADAKAYNFAEFGIAEDHAVNKIFHEAGVPVHQGREVIQKYQAAEAAMLQEATSAEGFKTVMGSKFGEKYEAVVALNSELHKKYLSEDSRKLFEKLPNNVLGGVYELTEGMRKAHAEEMAALKKEYGVVETGAQGDQGKTGMPVEDIGKVRDDLRNQIAALDARPHTAAEKKTLIDKLQATYDNQKKK